MAAALIWKARFHSIFVLCANTLHQVLCQSQYNQFMHSVMTKQAHTPSASLSILKIFTLKHGLVNAVVRCQYWLCILKKENSPDNRQWKCFPCSFRTEEREREHRSPPVRLTGWVVDADVTSPPACTAYQIISQPKKSVARFCAAMAHRRTVCLTLPELYGPWGRSSTFWKENERKYSFIFLYSFITCSFNNLNFQDLIPIIK